MTMNRPVLAANWKMNNGPTSAREFMKAFLDQYPRQNDRTVLFFPPAVSLTTLVAAIADRRDIMLGVQNVFWKDQGAFTGEISVGMARDAGARVVLVGHSERRHVFGETNEDTALKCAAVERGGLTPLLCVGELLEQREAGNAESVVVEQLRAGLSQMTQLATKDILVAYEPVWAIGTGKTATPEDATQMHSVIRQELVAIFGDRGKITPILYGGSVTPANAPTLLAAREVDGLLVGGASLDAGSWLAVARA
ncbi:MAG TPA: triose-phosphate isomerase [Gemmatimonadaceae bacterium]|nr:triose-phosphate isomerase [Gemmatimonadaceae bacterium]